MTKAEVQGFDLSKKTAAVIGCGGLGCNVAVHLAGEGVGRIYLCDFDTVSETNLNRQFLYNRGDLGKLKSETACEKLSAYAEDVEFIPVTRKITSAEELSFALCCDVIFLAVDNNEARKTVSLFCTENKIALVNGGISGFFGSAYLYVPDKSPCPECAGIFQGKTENVLSVSQTAGIIGALEAQLGTEYMLSGGENAAGRLYIYDDNVITDLVIRKNTDCKICNRQEE